MTSLDNINFLDQHFVGTVALKNEELTLPNGSKMALGIDDGHWVLIYQSSKTYALDVYKYDNHEKKIFIDEKQGKDADLAKFKELLNYFFEHARTEDLVTLLPPGAQ